MKKCLSLLLVLAASLTLGCSGEPDPTKAPGFVDTSSDPMKVMQTMDKKANPNQGGGGAAGAAGAGAGPAPGAGS